MIHGRMVHSKPVFVRALPALFLFVSIPPSDALAITAPAKVAYVEGKVLVLRNGAKAPEPAELGMSLFYGDQVKTLQGKCQINMTASGILRLSPNTTVLFPTEESKGDVISVRKMVAGKTVKNARQLFGFDPDEVFEVREPTLIAGVQDGGLESDEHPGHAEYIQQWKRNQQAAIERLRAEGNAKLDAIRAELKGLEGKSIGGYSCGQCGKRGPHRWTSEGWECGCGTTVVTFGNYRTSQGSYNSVRDSYRERIQAMEEELRKAGQ
jgi:ribosomal protein L37AE/L43A